MSRLVSKWMYAMASQRNVLPLQVRLLVAHKIHILQMGFGVISDQEEPSPGIPTQLTDNVEVYSSPTQPPRLALLISLQTVS